MNWKPPESELEWEECLSAYVDGELDHDSATDLRAHLERDPKRAQQLNAFQTTSAVLQSWIVDAPEPRAGLRASLAERRTRPSFNVWPKRVPVRHRGALRVAAAFVVGILVGGWSMNLNRPRISDQPLTQTVLLSPATVTASTVPPAQVSVVFKEVEAAALTQRIQQAARDGHWKNAVEGLARMEAQYSGTVAADAFSKGPIPRRIFRRSFRGRS